MNPVRLPAIFPFLLLAAVLTTTAQTQPAASPYLWSHFAGTLGGPGRSDGIGSAARFLSPAGVAVDTAGNAYVADSGNHTIRKITPTGVVSTLAGTPGVTGSADGTGSTAKFNYPVSVAVDAAGTVYVADLRDQTIRKITAAGVVTTLAGIPGVTGSADGTGSTAQFNYPVGVAVDAAGNVYVIDGYNHSIRKITSAGVVSTLAGNSAQSGHADGTGTAAQFSFGYPFLSPTGLTIDRSGNLYAADTEVIPTSIMIGNHTETGYRIFNSVVRKITADGVVTTLTETAGSSDDTGTSAPAPFPSYASVAMDGAGNLFMVAGAGNGAVRKVAPGGTATIVPGTSGIIGDSLAMDSVGAVIITNSRNNTVLKIKSDGTVATLAGLAAIPGQVDATGPAARLNYPYGVAVDRADNLYVSDGNGTLLRKITPAGVVSTVTLPPTYYPVSQSPNSASVAVDSQGNVYLSAQGGDGVIRKITPDGTATQVISRYNHNAIVVGGVALDRSDNLYFTDSLLGTINKVAPNGDVTVLAGTAETVGFLDGPGSVALFVQPRGLAVDGVGNVFAADYGAGTIRKIAPDGTVSTLAGTPHQYGHVDGIGSAAQFNAPDGLTLDRAGNIYVNDSGSGTIRKVTPDGTVTTVGGADGVIGSADGLGGDAGFNHLGGLAIDSAGNLYAVDSWNHAIRKGQPAGPPVIATQPQNVTVAANDSVQFSVAAGSVPEPTYQWYFNGSAFSGATSSTLSFTNARSTDAGYYTVVVTNEVGRVTSNKATLTISTASTPSPTPQPTGSGGGGSIEAWFALALLTLGAMRGRKLL